jgi:NADH dehydrogenase/NADH:ubiquinone oxidoreductase subunit G
MITLRINGKDVEAAEGVTVLKVCREAGIDIPTLCYVKPLGPYGVCRLCVVEAEGPSLPRTVLSSCNLPVSDGLVIESETPLIASLRKTMVELLMASSPVAGPLQAIAARMGVTTSRFTTRKADPCVLCGVCVRVCRDAIGPGALSFAGSDANPEVVAGSVRLDPEACVGCGTCANLCPVSAIGLEDDGEERRLALYGEVVNLLELVSCDICGARHTTRRFIELVKGRLSEEQRKGFRNLCTECGREAFAVSLTGEAVD